MNAADIVVMPSIVDGELEGAVRSRRPGAMACGRRVMASSGWRLPELVGGRGARLSRGQFGGASRGSRAPAGWPRPARRARCTRDAARARAAQPHRPARPDECPVPSLREAVEDARRSVNTGRVRALYEPEEPAAIEARHRQIPGRRERHAERGSPSALSAVIVPPCSVTMVRQIGRPSPVPVPTGLVVKKGSKIRSSEGGIDAAARVRDFDDDLWSAGFGPQRNGDLVRRPGCPAGSPERRSRAGSRRPARAGSRCR